MSSTPTRYLIFLVLCACTVACLITAGCSAPGGQPEVVSGLPGGGDLLVHFIDVGQGDSILVRCDGHYMLVDGGTAESSSLIYSYLKNNGIKHLDYMVATHPDADHIGGLAGALNYATVDTAYCPFTSYDTKTFASFTKYLAKQNKTITVPSAGDSFGLGSAEVTVVGPISISADDTNNSSIVLRIVYGKTSFLLTGDAEQDEEREIIDSGADITSTVLKVGHHGSSSSTSIYFLREAAPVYAVISVGEGNSYGHPTEQTLSRLRDADVKTYRTDMQGDIICTSDGKTVKFVTEKNADADTLADSGAGQKSSSSQAAIIGAGSGTDSTNNSEETYVLNTSTHKFHRPSCSSVNDMKEKNKKIVTESREEIIEEGYVPCKRCKP